MPTIRYQIPKVVWDMLHETACERDALRSRVAELEEGLREIATTGPDDETRVGKGLYARTVQVKACQLLVIA